MILENIHTPADVKALDREQLEPLCRELRAKQKAASIRKGNAGSSGTAAPTAPRPRPIQPRIT